MTHEQTPVQRAGFEVGDRAVVYGNPTMFSDGSIVELERDDGSAYPKFKLISGYCAYNNAAGGRPGGYCALAHVQKLTIPHYTPKPGDYVRTANLTESEYHQVAALFMAAGADVGEYPDIPEMRRLDCFGWYEDGDYLFHTKSWGLWSNGTELALHNGQLVPADYLSRCSKSKRNDVMNTSMHFNSATEQDLANLRRRVEKLESSGAETLGQDIRPSGFYWVKRGCWVAAEWDAGSQTWDLLGYTHTHSPFVADEALDTIGPRIHPPED